LTRYRVGTYLQIAEKTKKKKERDIGDEGEGIEEENEEKYAVEESTTTANDCDSKGDDEDNVEGTKAR
jgi:hypothetical protein